MVEKIINAVLILGALNSLLVAGYKAWTATLKKKELTERVKKLEEENARLKTVIENLER